MCLETDAGITSPITVTITNRWQQKLHSKSRYNFPFVTIINTDRDTGHRPSDMFQVYKRKASFINHTLHLPQTEWQQQLLSLQTSRIALLCFLCVIVVMFTNIWEHKSYRKSHGDSCTACRYARLYARRRAPLRHTAIIKTIQIHKIAGKFCRVTYWIREKHKWEMQSNQPVWSFLIWCRLHTEGSQPSFFSNGISLLLSFSKTSCNASICREKCQQIKLDLSIHSLQI